jgi:hypothetical protein
MSNELRNFLALTYEELEELNLKAKEQRRNHVATHKIQEERLKYLTDEKRIKAMTVLFSDLEGRLHMLDYDKKFLIKSWDNLTFDALPFAASLPNVKATYVWASTGPPSTGRPLMSSAKGRCWYSAKSSTREGRSTPPTFAVC